MKTKILHAALFTPLANDAGWGLPIMIIDEPGTAKTAVLRQLARSYEGFGFEHLSPSERGEGAFGVVPVPVKSKAGHTILSYPVPDWVENLQNGGIVVVDECTTAPPMLQAPMLGLVGGKKIGSAQLGPRVRVLGACNPPELAAHGHDLAPPLANRFGWIQWGAPTVEEHAAYMLGQASEQDAAKKNPITEEARVLTAWGAAYAQAVGLETGFLQAQANWKNKCPKAGSAAASRAWPSDRTWEMATRAWAASIVHGLDDSERDEFVTGFIGAQAFEAWTTYIEHADLPAATDLLDGKVPFEHKGSRLDRTAAIFASCAAVVTPERSPKRADRAEKLWEFFAKVDGSSLDLAVPAALALTQSQLHTSDIAIKMLAKLQPILTKTNMVGGRIS